LAREGQAGGAGRPRRKGRPRYVPRRKVCSFCVDKIEHIDYKEVGRLRRFVSDRGKIEPRRKTGTCARHQRRLSEALKRARFIALLPYTAEHIRTMSGRA
jgi:small subunit ribosomal protein S18